jgi:hypothetical protein
MFVRYTWSRISNLDVQLFPTTFSVIEDFPLLRTELDGIIQNPVKNPFCKLSHPPNHMRGSILLLIATCFSAAFLTSRPSASWMAA